MAVNKTTVDITITVATGSFITSCISILCGFFLIYVGAGGGGTGLSLEAGSIRVNFYSFLPGVAFALFGSLLAAWTVYRLVKK